MVPFDRLSFIASPKLASSLIRNKGRERKKKKKKTTIRLIIFLHLPLSSSFRTSFQIFGQLPWKRCSGSRRREEGKRGAKWEAKEAEKNPSPNKQKNVFCLVSDARKASWNS